MKERTEIRGDPHRIFIFSWKPLLGASEKISLEGGSGPGARVAVAAAVAAERAVSGARCWSSTRLCSGSGKGSALERAAPFPRGKNRGRGMVKSVVLGIRLIVRDSRLDTTESLPG